MYSSYNILHERLYCDGVFDLLHAGHLRHLEVLSSKCHTLIVGIIPYHTRNAGNWR